MKIDLTGKKILVTGGTRGIGREITRTLSRAGAELVVCYRSDKESASSLSQELKEEGAVHHLIQADVGVQEDIEKISRTCKSRFDTLDTVINNAGAISHIPFDELPLEEWKKVLDANLLGTARLIGETSKLLVSGSSIINVGSRVATVGIPLRAHYTASKAGLIGLTRSLAKEMGPRGIRVNVLAPGPIETDIEIPEAVREKYENLISLGRMGGPKEVANVALFLASDLSTFISGETVNVDGGI